MGHKHKKVFDKKQVEDTGQYYDPGASYGRTKDKPYVKTDKGKFDVQANKEDYYQWLMGKAGALGGDVPLYGGPTPFGQWLATSNFDNLQTGYNAARMQSGGRLEFRDYMKSAGYTPHAMKPAMQNVNRTGNPFTSTSYAGNAPTMNAFVADQGINRPFKQLGEHRQDKLQHQFNKQYPPNAWMDAQKNFLSLTPAQRGTDTTAYGYRPSRWAVF